MPHSIKNITILLITAITISLTSCKTKEKETTPLTREIVNTAPNMLINRNNYTIINTENAKEGAAETIQTLFDSIRYVQLDTKETIKNIQTLKIIRNKIYIFDDILKKLFIFNLEGKMSKSISLEQLGKNFDSNNFTSNYTNDKKINILNTSTNENVYPEEIKDSIIHNYYLALTKPRTGKDYKIGAKQDSVYRKALKTQPLQTKYTNAPQPQVNSEGKYLFTPTLSDTIYEIENDSTLKIKYTIQHENSIWQHKNEALSYDIIEDKFLTYSESAYCGTMFENKENAIFKLENGVNEYLSYPPYLYNKKTKQTYHLNSGIQKLSQIYLSVFPMAIYQNEFVSIIKDPYNYKKYFQEEQKTTTRNDDKSLYNLIKKANKNTNPILVFFE